jgi:signal transduction histidine kinase
VIKSDGSPFDNQEFPIPRAIRNREPVRSEVMGVYRPKKDDWIWLLVDALPIIDADDNLVYVVCTYSDISDLKNIQSELREKNEMLVILSENLMSNNNRLLEFTQIVSHNLRAPISNIVSLCKIYNNGNDMQKAQTIKHIDDVSNRALATIDDLNQVLKIQQQEEEVELERLNFQEVLNDVLMLKENEILAANAAIHSQFDVAEINYPVEYLESIYYNLLSNSLKFRKLNDATLIEAATYRDESGDIILEWKDNGRGMDMSLHGEDIFQLGRTFHSEHSSRGLGLFLIKTKINAMGGTIEAHSRPDAGMRIRINLTKNN